RPDGDRVPEVGCGAGPFTEVLVSTGAEVVPADAPSAVQPCRETVGDRATIVQADLFDLPFPEASFDRVFCFGVLQHTPDPRAAFLTIVRYAKPGGRIAADFYKRSHYVDRCSAKRLWRPLTTRLPRRPL